MEELNISINSNNEVTDKENIEPGHKSTEENKEAPGMLEFCCNMIGSTDACIDYLRSKGLLSKSMLCSTCNMGMSLVKRSDISDGETWRCRNCYTKTSIRKGSFFEVKIFNM